MASDPFATDSPCPVDLPSSPPFLPDHDHELPTTRRKRARRDPLYETATSSDPPIFSSDDAADASIEDYVTPRRKRQHCGTWWVAVTSSCSAYSAQPKAEFARNVDSGVWMRSDASEGSAVGDASQERIVHDEVTVENTHDLATAGGDAAGEAYVQHLIQRCLERGHEAVDLSDLSLQAISGATLRPLHSLIRLPRAVHEAPSSDDYESFTPSLQLYLSRNALRSVPRELWTLQNLTVLSLRNNKLTELSPSIANLHNLVELNVAGNRLRWLPYEMLRLVGPTGKLKRFSVLPNPLFQGIRGDSLIHQALLNRLRRDSRTFADIINDRIRMLKELMHREPLSYEEPVDYFWALRLLETFKSRISTSGEVCDYSDPYAAPYFSWKAAPVYLASTPVSFFSFDGSLASNSPVPPSSLPVSTTRLATLPLSQFSAVPTTDNSSVTRVPSLFELALRSCTLAPSLPQLSNLLPTEAPEPVLRGLLHAENAKNEGGRLCSVCGNEYVLPRAEWVEFWHYAPDTLVCSTDEMYLPYLRRACSWGCVGERAAAEVGEQTVDLGSPSPSSALLHAE